MSLLPVGLPSQRLIAKLVSGSPVTGPGIFPSPTVRGKYESDFTSDGARFHYGQPRSSRILGCAARQVPTLGRIQRPRHERVDLISAISRTMAGAQSGLP